MWLDVCGNLKKILVYTPFNHMFWCLSLHLSLWLLQSAVCLCEVAALVNIRNILASWKWKIRLNIFLKKLLLKLWLWRRLSNPWDCHKIPWWFSWCLSEWIMNFVFCVTSQWSKILWTEICQFRCMCSCSSDFAENCFLILEDEAQGCHWVNTQATVLPFAVYLKEFLL